jgi:hypothetical protein
VTGRFEQEGDPMLRLIACGLFVTALVGVTRAGELDRETGPALFGPAQSDPTTVTGGSELDNESPSQSHYWRGGWGRWYGPGYGWGGWGGWGWGGYYPFRVSVGWGWGGYPGYWGWGYPGFYGYPGWYAGFYPAYWGGGGWGWDGWGWRGW